MDCTMDSMWKLRLGFLLFVMQGSNQYYLKLQARVTRYVSWPLSRSA
jgi:hypothetical protein